MKMEERIVLPPSNTHEEDDHRWHALNRGSHKCSTSTIQAATNDQQLHDWDMEHLGITDYYFVTDSANFIVDLDDKYAPLITGGLAQIPWITMQHRLSQI